MVESIEDIEKVDYKSLNVGTPATQPSPSEQPKAVEHVNKPAVQAQVASAVGTNEFYEELEHMLHHGPLKVAPAAGTYLRRYGIMPNLIKATGPRGYILKGDVLDYI